MIRRLFARLIPGKPSSEARIYGPEKHPVRRSQLSRAALEVVRKLQQAGFKAFVVGGAVRDLMLGIAPKDFDLATDATPEQVKPLFRRAFIIGRRFRLVHVLAGPETVEVSTFRGRQTGDDAADEHGRLLTDNVFGTQAEDAIRRDFTMNALYFDPATESVWDFVGGVADVKARRLRLIGDPVTRYREDPVRMLRAARLAAKLGLAIEAKTAAPIPKLAPLIENVPPARVFDEMEKLLLSGHAVESLKSLRRHGLHHGMLPLLDVIVEQPLGQRFIERALTSTDDRVRAGKPVSPGFLFATLLWHEVLASWNAAKAAGERSTPALFDAMDNVLEQQAQRLAIPRRFEAAIKETWALQPRFEQRSGQRPFRLLEHPRFRAGYDFLRLRAESGEIAMELADWWERFQHASTDERSTLLRPDEEGTKRRRSRRRSRRKRAPVDLGGPDPASTPEQ
ncbi:MAG TPA: polynucleotide adenylyltransferase PcnB [Casimicrobiaceae bacterium]|nr:polynucleotide adenylyltransferase PcnB [Casimicrobiaceae bacterium]